MAFLNEEQSMIRDQAKSWVTEQAPVSNFRKMRDEGVALNFTPDTWSAMIEMGWTGIIVPERDAAGSDLGYLTAGLVARGNRAAMTASPLFTSALVGASALLSGAAVDEQKQAVLPKIVDGTAILTLALEEGPRHAPDKIALKAEKSTDGFKLTGDKTYVHEGMAATHFVVPARTGGAGTEGITLFLVAADAAGVSRDKVATMDSRGYANVHFDGVEVGADAVLGAVDQELCRSGE